MKIDGFIEKAVQQVLNNEYAFTNTDLGGFKLDDAFIQGFEGKEPAWGELGWFTFKRTYARRVEREDGSSIRTEEWTEVVRRVVEGNLSIIQKDPLVTQEYGQQLFWLIWNLVITPPGRGLWMSGTEFSKRTGDALNNCWFVETRPYHYGATNKIFTRYAIDYTQPYVSYPFVFLFDQAMKGGGVGFSAETHVVEQIPFVKNIVELRFVMDEKHPDYPEILESSKTLGFSLNEPSEDKIHVHLNIADSREGWAESLAVVIDEHFNDYYRHVVLDLSEIRGRGVPIRGFGGVASGGAPLVELLHFVNRKLNERVGQKIDSVLATDFHNAIGRAVVAGNVRRTAEVALASPYDSAFINMKNYKEVAHLGGWRDRGDGVWEQYAVSDEELLAQGYTKEQIDADRYTAWAQNNHRWASNNSVVIDDPRNYDYGIIAAGIAANGEPGVLVRYLAQNFGRIIDGYKEMCDKATGGNPLIM